MARSLGAIADRSTHKRVLSSGHRYKSTANTGNSGTIPFVVTYSPDPIWKAGASFRLFDITAGLEAITLDGLTAEAWPEGMVFLHAGIRLRVERLSDGRLGLVSQNGKS